MPFKKGQSGNPAGKAKGTRHKATQAMQALLEGDADAITQKAIELAKGGDLTAIRLCMDRLCPARRDRTVEFALPPIASAQDAVGAARAIVEAVATGELTPTEAAELSKVLDSYTRTLEAADFEARLARLEQAAGTR